MSKSVNRAHRHAQTTRQHESSKTVRHEVIWRSKTSGEVSKLVSDCCSEQCLLSPFVVSGQDAGGTSDNQRAPNPASDHTQELAGITSAPIAAAAATERASDIHPLEASFVGASVGLQPALPAHSGRVRPVVPVRPLQQAVAQGERHVVSQQATAAQQHSGTQTSPRAAPQLKSSLWASAGPVPPRVDVAVGSPRARSDGRVGSPRGLGHLDTPAAVVPTPVVRLRQQILDPETFARQVAQDVLARSAAAAATIMRRSRGSSAGQTPRTTATAHMQVTPMAVGARIATASIVPVGPLDAPAALRELQQQVEALSRSLHSATREVGPVVAGQVHPAGAGPVTTAVPVSHGGHAVPQATAPSWTPTAASLEPNTVPATSTSGQRPPLPPAAHQQRSGLPTALERAVLELTALRSALQASLHQHDQQEPRYDGHHGPSIVGGQQPRTGEHQRVHPSTAKVAWPTGHFSPASLPPASRGTVAPAAQAVSTPGGPGGSRPLPTADRPYSDGRDVAAPLNAGQALSRHAGPRTPSIGQQQQQQLQHSSSTVQGLSFEHHGFHSPAAVWQRTLASGTASSGALARGSVSTPQWDGHVSRGQQQQYDMGSSHGTTALRTSLYGGGVGHDRTTQTSQDAGGIDMGTGLGGHQSSYRPGHAGHGLGHDWDSPASYDSTSSYLRHFQEHVALELEVLGAAALTSPKLPEYMGQSSPRPAAPVAALPAVSTRPGVAQVQPARTPASVSPVVDERLYSSAAHSSGQSQLYASGLGNDNALYASAAGNDNALYASAADNGALYTSAVDRAQAMLAQVMTGWTPSPRPEYMGGDHTDGSPRPVHMAAATPSPRPIAMVAPSSGIAAGSGAVDAAPPGGAGRRDSQLQPRLPAAQAPVALPTGMELDQAQPHHDVDAQPAALSVDQLQASPTAPEHPELPPSPTASSVLTGIHTIDHGDGGTVHTYDHQDHAFDHDHHDHDHQDRENQEPLAGYRTDDVEALAASTGVHTREHSFDDGAGRDEGTAVAPLEGPGESLGRTGTQV